MSIFNIINEKYGLTITHLANLLQKTEKTLNDDLESNTKLSIELTDLLLSPNKLLKIVDDGKERIPNFVYKRSRKKIQDEIVNKYSEIFKGVFFLKLVKSNELGIRNGVPGKAGSFVLVPKECITMFPELSENELNSNATISLIIKPENEKRKVEFIYHNSKIVENDPNGRDEYRLYISNKVGDEILLHPDDIVLIVKDNNQDYNLYRYGQGTTEYNILVSIAQKYKASSSRSIAAIAPISELALNKINVDVLYDVISEEEIDDDHLDSSLITEPNSDDFKKPFNLDEHADLIDYLINIDLQELDPDTVNRKIKQYKRDYRFKKIVLAAYDNKCAISGKNISYSAYSNIQACHIIPKSCGGSCNPINGIALDMNYHYAFDWGMFTINNNFTIEVHELLRDNEILKEIHGQKIKLPEDKKFYPDKIALEYHRKNIYGKFLK
ncbi:HNH endonuclease [Sedimentibacter saalensis]|uniref:HNH endonuclease n=1 Tax=Sedimentibacter saalensis TaxID=130788 RepID=A0A562JI58_9FIRM|nr:HNH endonuclease [Sedimentibacter saalensis]TWH82575.1 HNH endonuclease [Sedimentibacter saalensis]